jgi:probable rRNA maturation factor
MPVKIHQQEVWVSLNNRKKLKLFIPAIFKKEKTALESLDIIFCSYTFLLDMNNRFLQHNYYTDIITFNLAEHDSPVIGELYISIDRVRDNARTIKTPLPVELHRTIFHGCLHLCGYGDKTQKEIITIRKKEDSYINAYLLST